MDEDFVGYLKQTLNCTDVIKTDDIQALWSNYGSIARYQLIGGNQKSVVIKHIDLSASKNHPRGWNTEYSHKRKVKSYQVEEAWYSHWGHLTNSACTIPAFLGSFRKEDQTWIVLEDLDERFPIRRTSLDVNEAKTVLQWLANFHGIFLNQMPKDLWQQGTYWHLATRQDEWSNTTHKGLKQYASEIDMVLQQSKFKTIVHGDAKLANFCFSEDFKVAAVDFQYVGGGCGMKDVTYLLGSCLTERELEENEIELLDVYFDHLKRTVLGKNIDSEELEKEWRYLYPFASADFMRFLSGWMPTHHKVNDFEMNKVDLVIEELNRLNQN